MDFQALCPAFTELESQPKAEPLLTALLILTASEEFPSHPQPCFRDAGDFYSRCLAGVFLPGGTIWWDMSFLRVQTP